MTARRHRKDAPLRAVVYARYSTDLQREDSIEDQVEVCRRVIDRNGWSFATVYHDRAMSGSSRFRPGYQQLLADAEQGRFDIVVCEALDRLGRKLSDIADLLDRLSFNGIKIHTVTTGEITALHIGMLGTMSQLFIADLREKTWRGQLGRARKGRIPGGRAFGYEVATVAENGMPEGGLRRINPEEATTVLRIFEEYAGGKSPRDIAKDLNAQGVPGPDARLPSISAGSSGTGSPTSRIPARANASPALTNQRRVRSLPYPSFVSSTTPCGTGLSSGSRWLRSRWARTTPATRSTGRTGGSSCSVAFWHADAAAASTPSSARTGTGARRDGQKGPAPTAPRLRARPWRPAYWADSRRN